MHLDLLILFIHCRSKVVKSHLYIEFSKLISNNLSLAETKATCSAKPKMSLSQIWLRIPHIYEQYWQI